MVPSFCLAVCTENNLFDQIRFLDNQKCSNKKSSFMKIILTYQIGLEFRSVQNESNFIKMDLEFELTLFYPEGQIMPTALLAHPDLKT